MLFQIPDYSNSTPAAPDGTENLHWQRGAQSGTDSLGNPIFPVSGNVRSTGGVNAQTGTSYVIEESDRGKLVTLDNSSAVSVELPVTSPATISSTFMCAAENLGVGTATLWYGSPAVTVATLATGESVWLFFDGASWESLAGGGSASALTLQIDGVDNGDQSLLNLVSGTNITLTDDGVGGVTIDAGGSGGVTIDTDGIGYVIPAWNPSGNDSSTVNATVNGAITDANNHVLVTQFVLRDTVSVKHISFYVTGIAGGSVAAIGVYDSSGNKLVAADNVSTAASGAKRNSVTTTVLNPGIYYLAQSASDIAVGMMNLREDTHFNTLLNAGTVKRQGVAANSMSSGVLPSTLGTITAALVYPVCTLLEA